MIGTTSSKEVFFGDLHGHSDLSFDSYLFGNRLTLDDSFQVAKGEPVKSVLGEVIRLVTPLDFVAMTDHAESFGMLEGCSDEGATQATLELCQQLETPSFSFFMKLRNGAERRPPYDPISDAMNDHEKLHRFANMTWKKIQEITESHNNPGVFTTFLGYEYSPPLPDRGKHHRNVIFKNKSVPDNAISAFDAASEIDLWRELEVTCKEPCEFITIPHNPNRSWGLAFASQTFDGVSYELNDWKRRDAYEPIVEMFQVKGSSECVIGFGTSDEECGFEQFYPVCEIGQETACIKETSMVRNGLKNGLLMEETLGFNPMDFGLIGSTDTHNSNPGDTEENDFRGASGHLDANVKDRLEQTIFNNPGGLAAIWSVENTRDGLFEAIQRKEVYATSGTRIKISFNLLMNNKQSNYPMGSSVSHNILDNAAPIFKIWAEQDPNSAPLHKIQLIKGWTSGGKVFERVVNIICSDDCSGQSFFVDLNDCSYDESQGLDKLEITWQDESYDPDQNVFYYIRVLEIPTCRWSTYDSLRSGTKLTNQAPSTIKEMAWSSPIWIKKE